MSDTLILGSAALSNEAAAADVSTRGWAELAPGVYWQEDADACEGAVTIDIVGIADLGGFDAHFLLMP